MQNQSYSANIVMPEDLFIRLQNIAQSNELSQNELILQALEGYADSFEQHNIIYQAGLQAYTDYKANGLHLINDEMISWLENLAQGNNVEPPKCHI